MNVGELKEKFAKSLIRSMIIAALIITPVMLVISGVFGKWRGLAGAGVGLFIAGIHSFVALRIVIWALGKPPQMLPMVLLGSYAVRIMAIAAIIYGVHFIKALDMIWLLLSFLALYIAHVAAEMACAWKSFGFAATSPGKSRRE